MAAMRVWHIVSNKFQAAFKWDAKVIFANFKNSLGGRSYRGTDNWSSFKIRRSLKSWNVTEVTCPRYSKNFNSESFIIRHNWPYDWSRWCKFWFHNYLFAAKIAPSILCQLLQIPFNHIYRRWLKLQWVKTNGQIAKLYDRCPKKMRSIMLKRIVCIEIKI